MESLCVDLCCFLVVGGPRAPVVADFVKTCSDVGVLHCIIRRNLERRRAQFTFRPFTWGYYFLYEPQLFTGGVVVCVCAPTLAPVCRWLRVCINACVCNGNVAHARTLVSVIVPSLTRESSLASAVPRCTCEFCARFVSDKLSLLAGVCCTVAICTRLVATLS